MACCTSGGSGHVVQLIQLRIGTVVTGKSGCLPQIINRWVERRIGMVRGTLVSNYVVMFVGDAVAEYLDNSRFAEATGRQQRQNQERDFAHWIIEKICQEQIGIIAGAMTMDKFQRVQYRACRTTTVER